MPTFTWRPTYSGSAEHKPKVHKAEFGDGYTQRTPVGLNNDLRTWRLTFRDRTDAERDAIMAFLRARKGAEPFDWTDTFNYAAKWTCEEYSATPEDEDKNTISATFVEAPGY